MTLTALIDDFSFHKDYIDPNYVYNFMGVKYSRRFYIKKVSYDLLDNNSLFISAHNSIYVNNSFLSKNVQEEIFKDPYKVLEMIKKFLLKYYPEIKVNFLRINHGFQNYVPDRSITYAIPYL